MTDTTTLIQRLREDLPKVNEPESQFSCVATPDIRQAADALEQQAAEEANALRTSLAHWKVFGEHAEGERSRLQGEVMRLQHELARLRHE